MKSSTANVLIIVGGCLIVAPLAFLYMSYRLITQMIFEAMARGVEAPHAHLDPPPPGYYVPICLILGALCIGVGVLLHWKEKRYVYPVETSAIDLS